jgi:hypothetical protein
MRKVAALLALTALAACQTLPAVVPGEGGRFDVRYDAAVQQVSEVDARAQTYCSGAATFISGETRFDGFAYRTYRCVGS